jgi:hypothetical protein
VADRRRDPEDPLAGRSRHSRRLLLLSNRRRADPNRRRPYASRLTPPRNRIGATGGVRRSRDGTDQTQRPGAGRIGPIPTNRVLYSALQPSGLRCGSRCGEREAARKTTRGSAARWSPARASEGRGEREEGDLWCVQLPYVYWRGRLPPLGFLVAVVISPLEWSSFCRQLSLLVPSPVEPRASVRGVQPKLSREPTKTAR